MQITDNCLSHFEELFTKTKKLKHLAIKTKNWGCENHFITDSFVARLF